MSKSSNRTKASPVGRGAVGTFQPSARAFSSYITYQSDQSLSHAIATREIAKRKHNLSTPAAQDIAFRNYMRGVARYGSLNLIPALRNWIVKIKEDAGSQSCQHLQAANQVAEWMRTNRHLFPKLKLN